MENYGRLYKQYPMGADGDSRSELVTEQGKEALESAVRNKAFLKLA